MFRLKRPLRADNAEMIGRTNTIVGADRFGIRKKTRCSRSRAEWTAHSYVRSAPRTNLTEYSSRNFHRNVGKETRGRNLTLFDRLLAVTRRCFSYRQTRMYIARRNTFETKCELNNEQEPFPKELRRKICGVTFDFL